MKVEHPPLIVLLAGPNGAGKSTFYDRFLSVYQIPFVNADLISLEVFGNQEPETAIESANVAEQRRREMVRAGLSLIFETVLSDPAGAKIAFLQEAQSLGYHVEAHFVGLASPSLSQARVIHRVARGGHDVPDSKIMSRFGRTLENLRRLIPVADHLTIYDNSEVSRPFRPIAHFVSGCLTSLSTEIPAWLAFLELEFLVNDSTHRKP